MRNRISTVAVVIASTLGVAACDGGTPTLPTGPATPERTYLVAGTVRDPSGSPVGDARVEVIAGPLLGSVTTTDQEGRFGFATPIPVSTAPTLHVTKDGYRSAPCGVAMIWLTLLDLLATAGFLGKPHFQLMASAGTSTSERYGSPNVADQDRRRPTRELSFWDGAMSRQLRRSRVGDVTDVTRGDWIEASSHVARLDLRV